MSMNTPLTDNPLPLPSSTPGSIATPSTLSLAQQAALIYPWWPPQLIDILVGHWTKTGDINQALTLTRKESLYATYFPGNLRADGTVRLGEADYYATVVGYRNVLRSYGIDPTEFESRGLFGQSIEQERSVNEVARDLSEIYARYSTQIPEIRNWYASNYGLTDLSETAVFASLIDEGIGSDILNQRLTSAQIGGVASYFGFTRDRLSVERLTALGVEMPQAYQVYGRAQAELPQLDYLARRWNDLDPDVGIGEFEDALVGGDVLQQRRFERLVRSEQTEFTGEAQVRRSQQGGLIGLRER